MPRLSQNQNQTRQRLMRLAEQRLSPEVISVQMMETVQQAIGWDGFRLFGVDPTSLLVNRLLASSENDHDARLEWLREVYLAVDPLPYSDITNVLRSGLRSVAFQEHQSICWGYPRAALAPASPSDHYRHYHELRSPVGGVLLSSFSYEQQTAILQAYRRDPGTPFRATDVTFLQQVGPIVGGGIQAALARERIARAERGDDPGATGILLIEHDGDIRFASPAAERWLHLLPDERDGNGLPTALWSAIASLRASSRPPSSVVVVPTGRGPVRVEASPGDDNGLAAIVITPHHADTGMVIPESWALTRQERQIVELLAQGERNRQIASRLSISEHTVEWHLQKVYDKLGVRSRNEVVAALFRKTVLPSMEAAATDSIVEQD
jgi:DNA-binding CsgD family transcriptional regulator